MSFTSLHWGAYRPQVFGGQLRALVPVEWDKDPSPIGDSVAAALTSPTRILRPAVRRSFLQGRGGSLELRGQAPFVEVSWELALELVANELKRVKAEHGNQAIFGGSSASDRFMIAMQQAIEPVGESRDDYAITRFWRRWPNGLASLKASLKVAMRPAGCAIYMKSLGAGQANSVLNCRITISSGVTGCLKCSTRSRIRCCSRGFVTIR